MGQGTNISHQNAIVKMIFLFPRWDMLVPWRVDKPGLFFCWNYFAFAYCVFIGKILIPGVWALVFGSTLSMVFLEPVFEGGTPLAKSTLIWHETNPIEHPEKQTAGNPPKMQWFFVERCSFSKFQTDWVFFWGRCTLRLSLYWFFGAEETTGIFCPHRFSNTTVGGGNPAPVYR